MDANALHAKVNPLGRRAALLGSSRSGRPQLPAQETVAMIRAKNRSKANRVRLSNAVGQQRGTRGGVIGDFPEADRVSTEVDLPDPAYDERTF